jgi:peptidoglycan/xylan/chitin deacetylase (PgdA/CDA1 family)
MMNRMKVRALHASGMALGGHTVNHPILARLAPAAAQREIEAGKRELEALVQAPVRTFAYPNGRPGDDFTAEHVRFAREAGFEAAVTTAWGVSGPQTDLFQLRRFTPWDLGKWRFGLRLWRNTFATPVAAALV